MKLIKWNYKTREYDDYEVPDDWNCKSYSSDMDKNVNCPHCGKEVKYGDCYTSMEIHTKYGYGYAVCEECYEKEIARRREAKKMMITNQEAIKKIQQVGETYTSKYMSGMPSNYTNGYMQAIRDCKVPFYGEDNEKVKTNADREGGVDD